MNVDWVKTFFEMLDKMILLIFIFFLLLLQSSKSKQPARSSLHATFHAESDDNRMKHLLMYRFYTSIAIGVINDRFV